MDFNRSRLYAPTAQLLLTATALAGISFWPPREGAMVLLSTARPASVVDVALGRDARIVGTLMHRFVVVRGARARLAGPLLRAGIVPLAAPAAWCGA